MNFKNKKKILKQFNTDKQIVQNQIQLSINKWKNIGIKENILLRFLFKKNKSFHWEQSKNIIGYYDIHLIWSNSIVRSEINVKKKDVITILENIKIFYKNISSITPDFSHPDILDCFNKTAKKNNLSLKQIDLKENIETEILDPFGGIRGFTRKKEEDVLIKHKNEALELIHYSLKIFENEYEKKLKISRSMNKLKCFEVVNNNKFIVNFYWNNKILESSVTKKVM